MVTSGDRYHDKVLSDIGGKGLFTKEIEEAMFRGEIDLAVHSMKDVQTVLPEGLVIAAILPREDARDALVGHGVKTLADLPQGAVVGTCSLRRAALVKLTRPDVEIVPLRGSVGTRLEKLASGAMHATLLAVAGLKRLEMLEATPAMPMSEFEFMPAIAQGALGLECREDNTALLALLARLDDAPSRAAVECERAFLRALDGSCRTPIAGHAHIKNGQLEFHGLIATPDGSASMTTRGTCAPEDATKLGRELGEALKADPKAAPILRAIA